MGRGPVVSVFAFHYDDPSWNPAQVLIKMLLEKNEKKGISYRCRSISWKTSKWYLPSYLPTFLPTYLPTYLPFYLPTYLFTYLPTYLTTYPGSFHFWCAFVEKTIDAWKGKNFDQRFSLNEAQRSVPMPCLLHHVGTADSVFSNGTRTQVN